MKKNPIPSGKAFLTLPQPASPHAQLGYAHHSHQTCCFPENVIPQHSPRPQTSLWLGIRDVETDIHSLCHSGWDKYRKSGGKGVVTNSTRVYLMKGHGVRAWRARHGGQKSLICWRNSKESHE